MSFFCRIGLHHWAYRSQRLDEPRNRTHTEIISARCIRDRCPRYGAWSLVHREAYVSGPTRSDSPVHLA